MEVLANIHIVPLLDVLKINLWIIERILFWKSYLESKFEPLANVEIVSQESLKILYYFWDNFL